MSERARRILIRVAVYGSVIFFVLPLVFAHVLTAPHPREHFATPPAHYEETTLVSGELELRAWLTRGVAELPAVVIAHGLGDTLESYQEHAQPFVERGHTVMLVDLRGHGRSDGGRTTLGGNERFDVRAAMDALASERLADAGVILMGHSMGAVAVLLAAAERDDVAAVIAEAPFDSYRNTVAHHAKLLYYMPSWVPIIPLAILSAEWVADFDADDVDAVAAAPLIDAPVLLIADGLDQRMPEPVIRRIVDAHPGPSELWVAEGVNHVGARWNPDWETTVFGFLEGQGLSSLSASGNTDETSSATSGHAEGETTEPD